LREKNTDSVGTDEKRKENLNRRKQQVKSGFTTLDVAMKKQERRDGSNLCTTAEKEFEF